jgi:hypothetical protein
MTQLTINGITLPQTSHDKYRCYPELLETQIEMISGRIVKEIRGHVWRIEWEYDYMGDALMRPLLAVLRGGAPVEVTFLPDNDTKMLTSRFFVTDLKNPTFAFSKGGRAFWHGIEFKLREVEPHD